MAAPLTSFDSFFDQLAAPQGSGQTYDLGGDTAQAPSYDVGNDAQPAPSQAPAQPSQPQAPAAPAAAPAASSGGASQGFAAPSSGAAPRTSTNIDVAAFAAPKQASGFTGSLFQPLEKQVGENRGKLQQAASSFSSAVSPFRQYGAETEGTLGRAIGSGAGAGDIDAAKGLVNAKYSGPTGLDQETLDAIQQSFGELRPRAASLTTAAGTEDLLRGRKPTLSSGQRRFEANRLLKDQGYRGEAAAYDQEIQNLLADYYRTQDEAKQIGTQRTQEEADIAEKSRGYLEGQQGGISDALAPRVEEAQTKDAALQAAFDAFQANPSEENLGRLNELSGGQAGDAGNFFTEAGRIDKEAEGVKASVMDKPEYAAIKDAPTSIIRINKHGRESLDLDPTWWKENKSKFPKKKDPKRPDVPTRTELRALVRKRNLELEAAGFSPGSAAAKNQKSSRQAVAKEVGKYSAYDPLYFSQGPSFEAADPRSYLNFKDASQATRDSLASDEERQRYNAISSILGSPDELQKVGPYQAAGVTSEADRYKKEQDAELKARREGLEESVRKETKQIGKARGSVRSGRLANALSKRLGNKTLGSTFAGILKGDPKAVANLPFALAAAPADSAMKTTGSKNDLSQTVSLVKAPKKIKKKKVSGAMAKDQETT